jgi:hypothetical protein
MLAWETHTEISHKYSRAGATPPDMLLVAAMILYSLKAYGTLEELGERVLAGAKALAADDVPLTGPVASA